MSGGHLRLVAGGCDACEGRTCEALAQVVIAAEDSLSRLADDADASARRHLALVLETTESLLARRRARLAGTG